MDGRRKSRGEGAFGTILGIAVLVLVGVALFKIVPLHMAGNKVLDAKDASFKEAGRVGLWTKADSVTLFDDFSYGSSN